MDRRAGRNPLRSTHRSLKRPIAVMAVVLVITIGVLYFAYGPTGTNNGLLVDWRLRLIINYNGTNFPIPAKIGVAGGIWNNRTLDQFGPPGYAPVSTRDDSGTIYVQSNTATVFTFGDFFSIWGQPFNMTCVLDYCAGQGRPLPSMSDGAGDRCLIRSLGLSNGKTWVITIGTVPPTGGCNPGTS